MRQSLALSGLAFLVGGCSIIYNPDHINGTFDGAIDSPPIDAPRPIDANAAGLTLTQVDSPILLEGQGTGASRKALLVIEGTNIVNGATVTISGAPSVIPDATAVVATTDSDLIAVPVTAMIHSGTTPSPMPIPLTVTVTQMSGGSPVSATIAWQLQELPELVAATGANPINNTNVAQYSHVALSGNATVSFTNTTQPVIIRAVGDLSITSTAITSLSVSASGTSVTGVFGGGSGGAIGANGMGLPPGPGKAGDANDGGGGAGFSADGTGGGIANQGLTVGDVLITSYMTNRGSGGGGGAKSALDTGGSSGGGAGGTIELTAGGDLTAPATSANAAGGAKATTGSAGGGGSGGVIVLRAGNVASLGGVSVAQGAGGMSSLLTTAGGAGSDGRARVEGATVSGSTGPAAYGAVFDPTTPQVVSTSQVMVTLDGASSPNMFELHDVHTGNNYQDLPGTTMIPVKFASSTFTTPITLIKGMNRLCMSPTGGPGNEESRNCIYVAYLP